MDDAVRAYIDGIDAGHRPLFDRFHRLIIDELPEADVVLSYKIPCYKVGRRLLYVGVWKHGVSLYGWPQGREADFTARHPGLRTSKGTLRVRPQDAADISDGELRGLIRAALAD
jgi:uncharacterized protein YdhG (YjbR/CyaY superfamily)